jgi:hypothetical protein
MLDRMGYCGGLKRNLGLIYLRGLYRQSLEANGVQPIMEKDWVNQHLVEFDAYCLVGFSKKLVDQHTAPVDLGQEMTAKIPTVLLRVDPVRDLSEIPASVELPQSTLPSFMGRLPPSELADIKGTSGGTIIGVKATEAGGLRYWMVALQSG